MRTCVRVSYIYRNNGDKDKRFSVKTERNIPFFMPLVPLLLHRATMNGAETPNIPRTFASPSSSFVTVTSEPSGANTVNV